MTVTEAAAALGCDVTTVRRLWRAGALSGERIGQRTLLLDAGSVAAQKERPRGRGYPRGKPRKPAAGPRGREEATDARD